MAALQILFSGIWEDEIMLWSNLKGHFAKPNKYDSAVSHELKTKQTKLH